MIFIEKMKNFKIYRTKTFLPTVKGDKKKGSAVLLLTPNYESSKRLMTNPMFVNSRRFESYYIERDVSYYINSKVTKEIDNEEVVEENALLENYILETKRSELKDSDFGVPSKRKFPLDTEAHVRSAIKFFNYVDEADEAELAKRIIAAMKKFNITDVKVSDKNRFSKYYKSPKSEVVQESLFINSSKKKEILSAKHFADNFLNPNCPYERGYGYIGYGESERSKLLLALKFMHISEDTITKCILDKKSTSDRMTFKQYLTEYDIKDNVDIEKINIDDHSKIILLSKGADDKLFIEEKSKRMFHIDFVKHSLIEVLSLYGLLTKSDEKIFFNEKEFNKVISSVKNESVIAEATLPDNIDTIVFDLGGVLVSGADWEKELQKIGIPDDLVKVYIDAYNKLTDQNDTASYDIAYKTFIRLVYSTDNEREYPLTDEAFDIMNSSVEKLYYANSLVKSLHNKGYKLYYLSNWTKYSFEAIKAKGVFDFLDIFEGGIVSYEVGMMKPSESIYKYFIDEYMIDTNKTIFIDDKYTNIRGAKDAGLNSQLFNIDTLDQLIKLPSLDDNNIRTDSFLATIPESCLNMGDKVLFFNESNVNDTQLKRMLYRSRIRYRKDLMILLDQVKKDLPWIRYAFPSIHKYMRRNIFMDLYFYNVIFFENNKWIAKRGLSLFSDYMVRLLNHPVIKDGGYSKKTIFIPIADWDKFHDATLWNYKRNINPISCIYQMMFNSDYAGLKKAFGDTDIVFTANDKYFKVNFSQIDVKDIKKLSVKFKMFCIKICRGEEFELDDIDTTSDNAESKEVIQAKLVDKIEDAKGVDLTKQLTKAMDRNQIIKKVNNDKIYNTKKATKDETDQVNNYQKANRKIISGTDATTVQIDKPNITKTTYANGDVEYDVDTDEEQKDEEAERLADLIAQELDKSDSTSDDNTTEDDVMDDLDQNEEIKRILLTLGNDDEVKISDSRAARMSQLEKELLDKEVKGKSIKDILSDTKSKEEVSTKVEVASPNKEEWSDMKFMNFDKNYNIDKDIINIFKSFAHCSRPVVAKDIKVTDHSTSEDRLALYEVSMEDYRGKRFTIKLDIPIMEDNRFLLRGNEYSVQTQSFNMPIIKTEVDTCQLISNYKKIFLRRVNESRGRSLPCTSKIIRASSKYKGRKIKFNPGNNTKICAKYNLPIDYIDLAGVFSTIESDKWIIYFNQDEIREKYTIEKGKGIPFLYNKTNKCIEYYTRTDSRLFANILYDLLSESCKEFADIYDSVSRTTSCAYVEASIMNSKIPVVLILAYHIGLTSVMQRAKIEYSIKDKLDKETRTNVDLDWIEFDDGYIVYKVDYSSSLLMSGLKRCSTEIYKIGDMDNKNIYTEMLDNFGGRIKADGLDNFYDLFVDPMIKESLEYYHLPTDYVDIILYGSAMLADNKYVKHGDTSSRRLRRYQLIAVYAYMVLSSAYGKYANELKHSRQAAQFNVKQSAVIDTFLTDSISSPNSVINALGDIETTNAITTKGPSGMNSDRAYSLDKRTYDDSMINVIGMSTGFAGNVGVTRQATLNANVTPEGYVKQNNGTDNMNDSNTLTATEALVPFGSTRDDPMRTAMSFIQTSKHSVRTIDSDPLLVTSGADEVIPYAATDKFAFKAKDSGTIIALEDTFMIVEYDNGKKDYINLAETTENNSDGGYFVPLKLDADENLKVGSKFKANQILAYDKLSFSNKLGESNNIAYNIGKIAKVAIINSDEGFEDSGVISASMARKLATRIELKYDSVVDRDCKIFRIAQVGDHIEAGDDLLVWDTALDDEATNDLIANLSTDEDDFSDIGKKKLKSEVTGVLKDIKIYRTVELEDLSPSIRAIVEAYEKPLKKKAKILKDNGISISKVDAHYVLPPTGKLKRAQDAILIEFYVEYLDTVGVGDKIVYNSANKAVEKDIFPEGEEPYTDFRPNEKIDAFVSVTSINKRMVSSSIIYGSLQKLMIELDRSVKDIMGIEYDDSTV